MINLANAPAPIVNGARNECSRIFRNAGITIDWLADAQPHIDELTMFISSIPTRDAPPHALGYVMRSPTGDAAVVVWSRVRPLVEQGTPAFTVLGRTMAHELGHLLLPDEPHSPVGLMRARWNERDLRTQAAAAFFLTAAEGKEMRCELMRRDQAEDN